MDGAADGDADVLAGVGSAQLFEHGVGFLFGDVLDDQQEFVASHAEDALGACGGDEDGRGFLDEQVAGLMAFRIVLDLEAVDVAEEEGERGAVGYRADEGQEGAAVADACELVAVAVGLDPVDHVAVAQHDGEDARQGTQQEDRGGEGLRRGVDDFGEAEGAARLDEVAGDEAREALYHGLEVGVELQERLDFVQDQHVIVLEVVVERLEARDGDVLRVLHDGFGGVAAPLVGAADGPVAALLEDQEALGLQRLANPCHHLADAFLGVGLLDADGDDVVDDFLAPQQGVLLGFEILLVVLKVCHDGEARILAFPWHEHVALQDCSAREVRAALPGVEVIALQGVIDAVRAGGSAPCQQLIALPAAIGIGADRQIQHVQQCGIEVEDVVGVDVDEGDAILCLLELGHTDLDAVAAGALKWPALADGVVEALGEQVEQRVESLGL